MVNSTVRIIAVTLVSLVVGAGLGGVVTYLATPAPPIDPARQRNDLVAGYGLLWSTLEDEAEMDKLGLLKRFTLDAPPERILSIMAQVTMAANNTLEELGRYRELEPRIARLPVADSFGTVLQAAMKEDSTKILLEHSPKFSKRLIISQAQALRMVIVLAQGLAKDDPNPERQAWLQRVAGDYGKMYDSYLTNLTFAASN